MLQSDARLTASQQALLDAAHDIGLRTLDGASRLLDLNLRTARLTLSETATRLRDAFEPLGDGDAGTIASRLSTPVVEQAAAYTRDACEIIAATHAEIVSVLGRRAHMPSVGAWFLVTPSITAATRAATTGSDMTETVEQIVHAVDAVVHAAEPAEATEQDASVPADVSPAADDSAPAAAESPSIEPAARAAVPAAAAEAPVAQAEAPAAEAEKPVATIEEPTLRAEVPVVQAAPPAREAQEQIAAPAAATPAALERDAQAPAAMVELPLTDEPPAAPKARQPLAKAVHQAIDEAAQPVLGKKAPAVARAAKQPAAPAKPAQPVARAGRAVPRRSSSAS